MSNTNNLSANFSLSVPAAGSGIESNLLLNNLRKNLGLQAATDKPNPFAPWIKEDEVCIDDIVLVDNQFLLSGFVRYSSVTDFHQLIGLKIFRHILPIIESVNGTFPTTLRSYSLFVGGQEVIYVPENSRFSISCRSSVSMYRGVLAHAH
jgi:hypothetical protein